MYIAQPKKFPQRLANGAGFEIVGVAQHQLGFQNNRVGYVDVFAGEKAFAGLVLRFVVAGQQPDDDVRINGYHARFLIDERVFQKDVVYTGGGSVNSLVRIRPSDLLIANGGEVVRLRK